MTKLQATFIAANNRHEQLLGHLRKAHRDLARAADDPHARRKALTQIDHAERAAWLSWDAAKLGAGF